jgi:hypothetical protein
MQNNFITYKNAMYLKELQQATRKVGFVHIVS